MRVMLLPFFMCTAITNLYGQDLSFDIDSKNYRATITSKVIKIDGHLDEEAWSDATILDEFIQVLPENNVPVNFKTEVRMLQNNEFLIVGIFCADSVQDYRVSVRRDFNEREQDCVGIVLDGFNDNRVALAFVTNPFGAQLDLMVYDDTDVDVQWDAYWFVKTSRTEKGWYAEFALPWETLRYKEGNKNWRLNVFRRVRSINELSAWSVFPRFVGPYRLQYAGDLFVEPPRNGLNFRVQPYVLSNNSFSSIDTHRFVNNALKYGLDLKWAITTKDVLDATINTDFAQADVDRRIVNTNRSSIFLPERRSFFLENSSLFSEGLKPAGPIGHSMMLIPFFSRRIGIDENGQIIPIKYGLRYVHRSSKLNYGSIFMQQQEVDADRTFNVNRISSNFGNQHRIGLLHTFTSKSGLQNQTFSADAFIRINHENQLKAMISTSKNEEGRKGVASYIQYNHSSNKVNFHWRQAYVGMNYDPAMGFISRRDVISTMPGFWLTAQPKWLPERVLFFEPGIVAEIFHRASNGVLQEYNITYIPFWFTFIKGSYAGIAVTDSYQNIDEALYISGMEVPQDDYNFKRFHFIFGSDASRTLVVNITTELGLFYNGKLDKVEFQLVFQPDEKIRISNRIEVFRFENFGVEHTNKTINLLISENRYAFNPRLVISAFLQYNTASHEFGSNLRFSWEYRPLSFVYIIYNKNSIDQAQHYRIERSILTKVGFLKQF